MYTQGSLLQGKFMSTQTFPIGFNPSRDNSRLLNNFAGNSMSGGNNTQNSPIRHKPVRLNKGNPFKPDNQERLVH